MLFTDVFGHTLDSEDFDIKTLAVRQRIFDVGECLFVDLVHVHGKTCVKETGQR